MQKVNPIFEMTRTGILFLLSVQEDCIPGGPQGKGIPPLSGQGTEGLSLGAPASLHTPAPQRI